MIKGQINTKRLTNFGGQSQSLNRPKKKKYSRLPEDPSQITEQQAMDQAMRFLTPRFLSTYELRQKMKAKKIPDHLIDEVEEQLLRWDYLNDERLAEQVLKLHMREEKYGIFFIKQKMKQRGLSAPAFISTYDELQAAFTVIERKFLISQKEAKPYIKKSKLISTLKNRGFSVSTINSVCNELSDYIVNPSECFIP